MRYFCGEPILRDNSSFHWNDEPHYIYDKTDTYIDIGIKGTKAEGLVQERMRDLVKERIKDVKSRLTDSLG